MPETADSTLISPYHPGYPGFLYVAYHILSLLPCLINGFTTGRINGFRPVFKQTVFHLTNLMKKVRGVIIYCQLVVFA